MIFFQLKGWPITTVIWNDNNNQTTLPNYLQVFAAHEPLRIGMRTVMYDSLSIEALATAK